MGLFDLLRRKKDNRGSGIFVPHKNRYINHCWNCYSPIDSNTNKLCPKCGKHYICNTCGMCYCDRPSENRPGLRTAHAGRQINGTNNTRKGKGKDERVEALIQRWRENLPDTKRPHCDHYYEIFNDVLFDPTKISSTQASYSFEFELPSTPNNDRIFNYANNLSKLDKFHCRWNAEVYADGSKIFEGSMTLNSYKGKVYKVNLVSVKTYSLDDIFGDDVRKDYVIHHQGNTPDGEMWQGGEGRFVSLKWYTPKKDKPQNAGDNGRNRRVLRYVDVVLMQAEALNETGNREEALEKLNLCKAQVNTINGSTRLYQPGSYGYIRDQIYSERRMELAYEWDRYFDLVRQGRAAEVLHTFGRSRPNSRGLYFIAGVHERMPIPQNEIDISNGVVEQNPGY